MTASTTRTPSTLPGAWLWLFCFQFFVAEQIARLGWKGNYSMARNVISDLGMLRCDATMCSPLHWLMNASFVLQGLLIFLGALLLRSRLLQSLWLLFAVAGIGVLVVGLVPESTGSPLHLLGAAANFVAGNLGMIWLGWRRMHQPARWQGVLTLMTGVVGMMGTLAVAMSLGPSLPTLSGEMGLVERLAAYPLPLWLTWTGLRTLRRY